MTKRGHVFLVGAGPGDPEMLTLKAARLLGAAQAVVYDRLVSAEVLKLAAPGARIVAVGKAPKFHPVPQSQINDILVTLALEGLQVVRLKGGDPFIFGRGSEEMAALHDAGIPVEIVPGITAAQGAATATGVPLTHRGLATGVRYVTGHCRSDRPLDLDWRALADPRTTLVVYMGVASIAGISEQLIENGMDADIPAMAVENATTPGERSLVSTLGRIAADTAGAGFRGPVVFTIGHVVSLYRECPAEVFAQLALDQGSAAACA
jgi:uroporphyrin-III C-methyltransferase